MVVRSIGRTVIALALAALTIGLRTDSARAAAPWFILVHGPLLAEPVLLNDWNENLDLMLAISERAGTAVEELEARPYLDLALFWGAEWEHYPRTAEMLRRLAPEQANQRGRFYPAVGDADPLYVLLAVSGAAGEPDEVRRVGPRALEIFARYGVPTRVDEILARSRGSIVMILLFAAGTFALLLGARRLTRTSV
jgi:hypothetical protein